MTYAYGILLVIVWFSDLFFEILDLLTWRIIQAFDLGIPSIFRKYSTVSDVPEALTPYNGRSTWYLVLICAEVVLDL